MLFGDYWFGLLENYCMMPKRAGEKKRGSMVRRDSPCVEAMGCRLLLALLGLRTASAGLIDMDTPLDKRTTTSFIDGSIYHLVSVFLAP
jgi:hypothetical protein